MPVKERIFVHNAINYRLYLSKCTAHALAGIDNRHIDSEEETIQPEK